MTHGINRRRVLALLAAAGVTALARAEKDPGATLRWLAEGIDALALRDLASGAPPGAPSYSLPVVALLQDESLSEEQVAQGLRRLVIEEYAAGRTVALSGWQVSRTEAYLYGVLARGQG